MFSFDLIVLWCSVVLAFYCGQTMQRDVPVFGKVSCGVCSTVCFVM